MSVAKLRSGMSFVFRNVLSTTILGVLPTKIALPPALTKARKRSSPGACDHRHGRKDDRPVNLAAEILEAAVLDGRHGVRDCSSK